MSTIIKQIIDKQGQKIAPITNIKSVFDDNGTRLDVILDTSSIKSGLFSDKPLASSGIGIGFAYFCTDKQSPESSSPGLVIFHKGNDVWVDSLGRIVNDNYTQDYSDSLVIE